MKKMYTCFKTPYNNYIYDGNKNVILKLNEDDWMEIKENKNKVALKKYRNYGYLKESKIKKIEHS